MNYLMACGTVAALVLPAICLSEDEAGGHDTKVGTHWGYESDDGPARWGSMNPDWKTCSEGKAQSPIDLAVPKEIVLPEFFFRFPSDTEVEVLNQEGVIDALDNGHTIQVNAQTGEYMRVEGKTYWMLQFHFHSPSEHTVDGRHYPMEVHFVHMARDGALAVVGVFAEVGAENLGFAPIWPQLMKGPGMRSVVTVPAEFTQLAFLGEATGAYHYEGSLTTPPCTEGVHWFIRRTPTQFSAEQIAVFTAMYDHNNRPVQPLNERVVHLDPKPKVTIE